MVLKQVRISKQGNPSAARPAGHLNLPPNLPRIARTIDADHQLPARGPATQNVLHLAESFVKK